MQTKSAMKRHTAFHCTDILFAVVRTVSDDDWQQFFYTLSFLFYSLSLLFFP